MGFFLQGGGLCKILVPVLTAVEVQSLNHWTSTEVPVISFIVVPKKKSKNKF